MSTQEGVSVPHLVMGLVFTGLAGAWALHEVGVIGSVEAEWLLPLILVVAGAAGLLATVGRSVARARDEECPRNGEEETFVTEDDPAS